MNIIEIVTPCLNSEKYINQTILSVVSQSFDGIIKYHVQDAGSKDSTLDILKKWKDFLSDKKYPFGSAEVQFTYKSEFDNGMYDGISRGFDYIKAISNENSRDNIIMSWINSDDYFNIGAFQTVFNLFKDNKFTWITGLPSHCAEDGQIADVRTSHNGFSRREIFLGKYDGRKLNFIQQEGTFWTNVMWDQAGGLNKNLKLAGDWDLWRRFAKYGELITAKAVLAIHRRHANQKSNDYQKYWDEIDSLELNVTKKGGPLDLAIINSIEVSTTNSLVAFDIENKKYHIIQMPNKDYLDTLIDDEKIFELDFRISSYPNYIHSITGVSVPEEFGVWSDKNLASSVRITFNCKLTNIKKIKFYLKSVDENLVDTVSIYTGSLWHGFKINASITEIIVEDIPNFIEYIDIQAANSIIPDTIYNNGEKRNLSFAIQNIIFEK